jgi:hypothetical protein
MSSLFAGNQGQTKSGSGENPRPTKLPIAIKKTPTPLSSKVRVWEIYDAAKDRLVQTFDKFPDASSTFVFHEQVARTLELDRDDAQLILKKFEIPRDKKMSMREFLIRSGLQDLLLLRVGVRYQSPISDFPVVCQTSRLVIGFYQPPKGDSYYYLNASTQAKGKTPFIIKVTLACFQVAQGGILTYLYGLMPAQKALPLVKIREDAGDYLEADQIIVAPNLPSTVEFRLHSGHMYCQEKETKNG